MTDVLSAEEIALLEGLQDPDDVISENYDWDEEVQREIIGLLINDRFFLIQSNGLIKPKYFTNECHRAVAKIVFEHFDQYRCLLNRVQLTKELKQAIENRKPEVQVFYLGELNTIINYYLPGVETREYYLDEVTEFAKGMAMKEAFNKCLDIFKNAKSDRRGIWGEIRSIVDESMNVDRNFDIGLDYFNSFEERYARMKLKRETGDYFITGFSTIDEAFAGGGLARGEIGAVVGLPGTGKSIFLVNAAMANMHRDKKVLYISLEIDGDKCAERFDAQFANPNPYGKENTGITTKNLYENEEVVFNALRNYVSERDDRRLMVVKQFPGGWMGMSELRAYYAQSILAGFQPDLVVVDYVGEMKDYPGMPTWESRTKIVRDLRGFAVENDICVLTAMQVDGKSREAVRLGGIIDDDNLADAKGQNRPLDLLISINQLQDERDCSLARLFNIKTRDGKARFTTHIEFDYGTLRMREISENKYKQIFSKYKNEKTETVADQLKKVDEIVGPKKKKSVERFAGESGYQDVEDVDPGMDPDLAAAIAANS